MNIFIYLFLSFFSLMFFLGFYHLFGKYAPDMWHIIGGLILLYAAKLSTYITLNLYFNKK
jgi:hypothetical protein